MDPEIETTLFKLTITENGNVKQSVEIEVTRHMTLNDIKKYADRKKIRLFDTTGDELLPEDVEYLKNGQILFISQGEDFRASSSLALYSLIRNLGEGGFGSVKLFIHKMTKKEYAIKFMKLKEMESQEDVDRIFSEIGTLRNFNHPYIVKIIESFFTEKQVCIVMEYCKGGELKNFIRNQPDQKLSEENALIFAKQIAGAMLYCHQYGVIHRDLKLENILLAEEGQMNIKVVDFGISGMFVVGGDSEKSDAGSLCYIAPEILTKVDNSSTPAVDV